MSGDSDLARLHLYVDGTVQGVGFRMFVQDEARARRLTGWVRNLYDGRVEVLVEGPRPELLELLDRLRTGPRSAFVTHVQQEWEPHTGEFRGFEILRTLY